MLARLILSALLSMGVMVFSLALYGMDGLPEASAIVGGAGDGGDSALAFRGLFRLGALALSAPVLLLLGLPLADSVPSPSPIRRRPSSRLTASSVTASPRASALSTIPLRNEPSSSATSTWISRASVPPPMRLSSSPTPAGMPIQLNRASGSRSRRRKSWIAERIVKRIYSRS